jgi:hypothetical protein
VKLATHLHLVLRVLRSRIMTLYAHLLVCLYGSVLYYVIKYGDKFPLTVVMIMLRIEGYVGFEVVIMKRTIF